MTNELDITVSMQFTWKPPSVGISNTDQVKETGKAVAGAITEGTSGGLQAASKALKPALNDAMAQSVWNWPNVTLRKNTSDVDSPRDIIDTANLRDSVDIQTSGSNGLQIIYTAPYAAMVHYGGITRPYGRSSDSFVYPARPWISALLTGSHGIEQFKVLDVVDQQVLKNFQKSFGSRL